MIAKVQVLNEMNKNCSNCCYVPKTAPKDSLGLRMGGTGPKNRQESKSGLQIRKKTKKVSKIFIDKNIVINF